MFAKGKRKGLVQFSIKPQDGALEVYLAGAFREWKQLPMRKLKDGRFALELPLAPGAHEYKFLVDGQWVTDPDHSHCVPNAYGSSNSVARIE